MTIHTEKTSNILSNHCRSRERSLFCVINLGVTFLKPISCYWCLSVPPENIRTPEIFMFSGDIERDQRHEMGKAFK